MTRTLKILPLLLLVSALASPLSPAAARQAPAAGQGSSQEATQTLVQAVAKEKKKDAETWFRLGIEYNRAGEVGKARDAFEQALKLRPKFTKARAGLAYTFFVEKNFAEAEREAYRASVILSEPRDFTPDFVLATIRTQRYRAVALDALAQANLALSKTPDAPNWNLLKAEALIGLSIPEAQIPPDLSFSKQPEPPPDEATRKADREENRKRFKEAADCIEKYLGLARPTADEDYLRAQLEALRFYSQELEGGRFYSSSELSSKALIEFKPIPGYTPEARKANWVGMVRLRVTLAADGKVRNILVLMPLRYGLTEEAVKAARKIKFKPATVDGAPVSQYVILEYNFG